jgi:hypothetical protein
MLKLKGISCSGKGSEHNGLFQNLWDYLATVFCGDVTILYTAFFPFFLEVSKSQQIKQQKNLAKAP